MVIDIIARFIGRASSEAELDPHMVFPDAFLDQYNAASMHSGERMLVRMGSNTCTVRVMFTSNMGGNEVHGNVVGFTQKDMTSSVRSLEPDDDDDAHSKLQKVATPIVMMNILGILNDV
jgi:hypothetical protein